jgi:ABC-type transport system involved in multi-copper enzyme maturation permease subunit
MKLKPIIINTFIESVRDRILIILIVLGLLLMASAKIIQPLALGEESKIIKDLGLSAINLVSVLIAIFVGGRLIYKEIEKRTIYIVLSKPVRRWEFILGKFFGLLLVLFVSLLILAIGFFIVLLLTNIRADFTLLLPLLLLIFQLAIITALAIFFSTFVTPIGASIFTFILYFIGHLTRDLKAFAAMVKNPVITFIANLFYYLLPNLANFNIKGMVVHNVPIPPSVLLLTILYGILYSAGLLFLSVLFFQRKDL